MDFLTPFNFLRSFYCVAIVAFHCFWNGLAINTNRQDTYAMEMFKEKPTIPFINITMMGVDVFFMMSGCLTTLGLLVWNQRLNLFGLIVNRYLRLLPAQVILIIASCVADPYWQKLIQKGNLFPTLNSFLFFYWSPLVCLDSGLLPSDSFDRFPAVLPLVSWSTCIDMQMSVVLYVLIPILRKHFGSSTKPLWCLLGLSLVMRYVVFAVLNDSIILNPAVHLLHSHTSSTWLVYAAHVDEFNHAFQCNISDYPIPSANGMNASTVTALFSKTLYFPLHTRFSPFLVGCILAYALERSWNSSPSLYHRHHKLVILSSAICYFLVLLYPIDFHALPPVWLTMMLEVVNRTLYTLAVAALAFVSCCASSDARHSPKLHWFMSWDIFQPIAQLSYGIYLFHYGLQFYAFRLLKPRELQRPSKLYLLGIFGLVFSAAAVVSLVEFRFVEVPCTLWRKRLLTHRLFQRKHSRLTAKDD